MWDDTPGKKKQWKSNGMKEVESKHGDWYVNEVTFTGNLTISACRQRRTKITIRTCTHCRKCKHLCSKERHTSQCSSISPSEKNIWRASVKSWTQSALLIFIDYSVQHAPSCSHLTQTSQKVTGLQLMDLKWNNGYGCEIVAIGFNLRVLTWKSDSIDKTKLLLPIITST